LRRTRYGGAVFFLTCGLTHLHMAAHTFGGGGFSRDDLLSWHMLVVHIVQAFSVWFFVTGLYEEFGQMKTLSELERRMEEEQDPAVKDEARE
jgi:O-antigen/teichoic acid export membrane protein